MTGKSAYKLLDKYHVPENIKDHCKKVAYFAEKVAKLYSSKGFDVDVDLVKISALLHDIFRIIDIQGKGYLELCKKASKHTIELWEDLKKWYKGLYHCQAAAKYFNQIRIIGIIGIKTQHQQLGIRFNLINESIVISISATLNLETISCRPLRQNKFVSITKP